MIVCGEDQSTDDEVAVILMDEHQILMNSDPATRLSRLCDDTVILHRSEFYTADPLSSQEEPTPISTRTELLHLKIEGFSSSPVYVTGVYAKSTRAARRVLWADLLCLQQQIVELLNRATSDHSPMLYNCATPTSVPSSFKFQDMWIRHPTFQSTVVASWEQPQEGYGMYRFSRKLRRLKEVLKHWNKDVFGNVFDRVRQAEATVKSLEQIFDSTQADVDLIITPTIGDLDNTTLLALVSMEEGSPFQKV
ncbi:hypothetical protein K2173_006497 [Erythroxylum novogranatense]|uniref:Uncharacterized protein n=1 Tax=Erythroxylum novogranatense TaxID=1862640 RepID=A0AAV8SKE6_9ROSI|nr:hypothetical protein K2173_006497 [Erythroxylum novogranatense]